MSARDRPQIADSPWFWALLFALFALALLMIFGDKYRQRQTQIERQFQSKERREAMAQSGQSRATTKPYSWPDNLIMPLWPMIVFLVAMAVLSGIMLLRGPTIAARRCPRPGSLEEHRTIE